MFPLIFLTTAPAMAAVPDPLLGDLTCDWGSADCNACVNDVEDSFANLEDGYTDQRILRLDANDDNGSDKVQPELTNAWSEGRHLQGVGRLPILGEPVFVASRNTGLEEWGEVPGVFSALLGEYQSDGGNLLAVTGEDDAENRVIAYITTDDDDDVTDLAPVDHTGGIQTIGTYVVAGSGCVNDPGTCGGVDGRIDIFDFGDPSAPALVARFVPDEFRAGGDPGMVGIARLDSGRYLLTVNGSEWYVSDGVDLLTTGWSVATAFDTDSVVDECGDGDTWLYKPQNVNLVTECGTGAIYAIATDDSDGEDQAALYLVESDGGGGVALTKRAHLRSPDKDGGDDSEITFDADANVYVTAEGQLTLYATGKAESDSDGDIRIMEFYNYNNECNDVWPTSSGRTDFITCERGAYFDDDGDGETDFSGDCDDANAAVYPGAPDTWYDGIDSDCAGNDDFDQDADGSDLDVDCNDVDAAIHPGAADAWYDGVDSDCASDDDFDQDADGSDLDVDCNDVDAAIHPGAVDAWYDGVDSDCAGDDDFDQDGDGYQWDIDCDDTDAFINPGAGELPGDDIDQDCFPGNEDEDGDGWAATAGDCDDEDGAVWPGAPEICDGADQDCDGLVDNGETQTWYADSDGDGAGDDSTEEQGCTPPASSVSIGGDCDDADPARYPDATEVPGDGIDQDCDEADAPAEEAEAKDTGEVVNAPLGCACNQGQPSGPWALLVAAAAFGRRRRVA